MNNEINGTNNMNEPMAPASVPPVMGGQPTLGEVVGTTVPTPAAPAVEQMAPTSVPPVMEGQPTLGEVVGTTVPTPTTPIVEPTPVAPMVEPVAPQPVAPVVEPTPVAPTVEPVAPQPVAPAVEPTPVAPTVEPVAPQPVTPMVSSTPVAPAVEPVAPQPTEEKKSKNSGLIIAVIIVILLAGVATGVYFVTKGKNKVPVPTDTNPPMTNTEADEFLALANEYVAAVEKLWTSDSMVCQNATNQTELLKPSELSSTDAYAGNAFYYVFINTLDSSEMKLDVTPDKDVAGWIRIGKNDNSYYVALSDGTNYIVDTGTEFGTASTNLTANDVVTTGNGANYQYMNGQIYGSNTDGNGWGIGDYLVLSDNDETNDGIYMSNGKKDAGWTPFCSNAE